MSERLAKWYPMTIEKASDGRLKTKGIISTGHEDRQGDTINQDGLDFKPFLKYGWLNDNHSKATTGVVGYPEKVYKTRITDDRGRKVDAWAMEGYLLDTPEAHKLAALAESLKGTPRQLGFSVEGPPPTRDPMDPSKIIRATVYNVAVTNCPVNPYTSMDLVRSMDALHKSASVGSVIGAPTGVAIAGSLRPVMPQSMRGTARMTINPDALAVARAQKNLTDEWLQANGAQLAKGLSGLLAALRRPTHPALARLGG